MYIVGEKIGVASSLVGSLDAWRFTFALHVNEGAELCKEVVQVVVAMENRTSSEFRTGHEVAWIGVWTCKVLSTGACGFAQEACRETKAEAKSKGEVFIRYRGEPGPVTLR